jgi:hypothetical protein
MTGIGLILLISDRKGFLRRMKGNKLVAALLVIFGLILIGEGLFIIAGTVSTWNYENTKIPGHPMTLEESAIFLQLWAWAGLASISGILWIVYGLKMWGYAADVQPLEQEINLKSQTKYPRDLFAKYAEQYHNPSGVLGFHISLKMRKRQNKRTNH